MTGLTLSIMDLNNLNKIQFQIYRIEVNKYYFVDGLFFNIPTINFQIYLN